jgi:hypothetical protein
VLRKRVAVLVAAAMMMLSLFATAAPAFAFIHAFVPAEDCTPAVADKNGGPADNETAEEHIPRNPIEQPPAPDDCPAPQK